MTKAYRLHCCCLLWAVCVSNSFTVQSSLGPRSTDVGLQTMRLFQQAPESNNKLEQPEPSKVDESAIEEDAVVPSFGFNPDNFDESALPIPLWTSLVVVALSLYVTFYGFYVGLNGFPDASGDGFNPPRPF